jgi:hypothetical protein
MADNTVVHIGENSPEQVAYTLLRDIANIEQRPLFHDPRAADRKWILDTYAECLIAIRNPVGRGRG